MNREVIRFIRMFNFLNKRIENADKYFKNLKGEIRDGDLKLLESLLLKQNECIENLKMRGALIDEAILKNGFDLSNKTGWLLKVDPVKSRVKPSNYGSITNRINKEVPREYSFVELASVISEGRTFSLASYKKDCLSIKDNPECMITLALDIDGDKEKFKDKKHISREDFITFLYAHFKIMPIISYNTYSDTEDIRFRLIYVLENEITDMNEYRKLYTGLLEFLKNYCVDYSTSNPNRIWAGTNKKVHFDKDGLKYPITEKVINKLKAFIPIKEEENAKFSKKLIKESDFTGSLKPLNMICIKAKYHREILDMINEKIDIVDFLKDKFSLDIKREGRVLKACCPFHNEKKPSFVIYENTNSCHCFACGKGGGVFATMKLVYDGTFSQIVFRLMQEYQIELEEDMLTIKRGTK